MHGIRKQKFKKFKNQSDKNYKKQKQKLKERY